MSFTNSTEMQFPKTWDITNPYALEQYKKCKRFYSYGQEDDFVDVYKPSVFFNIFCSAVIVYSIVSSIFIIIKRNNYKKMNWNISLSLLFSIGTIINVVNFFLRRYKYYDYPCFLVPILTGIGYPLCFLSCAGHILLFLKQCYINMSLYDKYKKDQSTKNNEFNRKDGYLRGLCATFTEVKLIKIIYIYVTVAELYVVLISTFEVDFTMRPISQGFCTSIYGQLPEYLLIVLFILIFSPMAIHDIRLFRNIFSFSKIFLVTFILITICSILYVAISYYPKYQCSSISKYLPVDFYIVLLFFLFNVSFITAPLIESINVNKHIESLELTKKGLLKVFNDEHLYKDFFEYAVMKRSVEYVLFHVEYVEFKSIFLANRSILEEFRNSGLTSPGPKPSNPKDKKAVQVFEQIYNKAGDIYNKYFNDSSELQLNLPAKMAKEVNTNLFNFNIYYGRNYINAEEGKPVDLDKLICENIFDKVHSEAIESLFLNVYSSFAKEQKVNRSSKNLSRPNRDDSIV